LKLSEIIPERYRQQLNVNIQGWDISDNFSPGRVRKKGDLLLILSTDETVEVLIGELGDEGVFSQTLYFNKDNEVVRKTEAVKGEYYVYNKDQKLIEQGLLKI